MELTMRAPKTGDVFDCYRDMTAAAHHEIECHIEKSGKVPSGYRYAYEEWNDKTRLDVMGDVLNFHAEYVMRQWEEDEIKNRTRAEWAEMEREYVVSAKYTAPDLKDDLLTFYERGLMNLSEYGRLNGKYRKCRYMFCEEVFRYKHGNQWYCCENHKDAEKNAKRRFEKTGIYLPESAYDSNLERYEENKFVAHEFTAEAEYIDNHFGRVDGDKSQIARTVRGDSDKRDYKRDQRARSGKRREIDEQIKKYENFKAGKGEPTLCVDIKTGKVSRKNTQKSLNSAVLQGNELHKCERERAFEALNF
jgi:hypothetical protein